MRFIIICMLLVLNQVSLAQAIANEEPTNKSIPVESSEGASSKNPVTGQDFEPLLRKSALQLQEIAISENDQSQRQLLWDTSQVIIQAADVIKAEDELIAMMKKVTKDQHFLILQLREQILRLKSESSDIHKI